MAVFRVERTRDYTVMSNHHLKNRSLSLKAKGLLSVMLSLPDEWDYTLRGLAAISKEGVDAIREAIRELEDAGYIVRSRGRNEKGQLSGTEYVIYEHPQQSADAPVLDNPTQEKSVVADEPKRESKAAGSLNFNTFKAISESCETSDSSGKTPMWENPTLDHPTLENPTLENPTQLNTKRSKTNYSRRLRRSGDSGRPRASGRSGGRRRSGASCYGTACNRGSRDRSSHSGANFWTHQCSNSRTDRATGSRL